MQIERLVQMVFHIIKCEHITAKELADYFKVSTRTIYRDINTLTLAGIPIISSKGTGGGISLVEGFTIDKGLFSKEEQLHIYQGLQMLQATKYPNAEMALNKVGAIFRNIMEPQWLDIDFTFWGSDEKQKVKLSDLQYAIVNKHTISFYYYNSELQKADRIVEPLRLVFKSHAWYIVGYCQEKQAIRIFRLSRMKKIQVMPDTFVRSLPKDYSVSKCNEAVDLLSFKVKFSPEIAVRLFDEFKENEISVCEDGCYLVTFQYELSNWTFNRLLSYGKYVEILEPEIARSMLKEKALEIAKIYE
ncbi:putative DNA-binding transcriptional regulator YafY [Enterococcus sp. PF1-24]|uniref:helix-turn-helix transcriptional regulator n=1 Tax=unclassified Enterococcus TaxID=2608891 RepID=UPI0024750829|nr:MULTISPECIES: YafY family protein [unclassified Enterococcus]MDH6364147.1 putative DNA-binding transcriptional regulator YafY [Enterococcus sp. PFB1-1]MDH6401248.1 putative DNA-binding transcriptional regulator YafY [Enterococcus sp. PF1-24]